MFRILAIGNSFSEDATYYLHQILEDAGIENQVVNMYIGGCSLEHHWQNIENNSRDYMFQINGHKTDRYVGIDEMLTEAPWDAIVTQQASHDSGWLETYEPFLGLLLSHIKEKAKALVEVYMQETWAYSKDSNHGCFMRYDRDQVKMYDRLKANYSQMAKKYDLKLIPCGDLIQELRKSEYFADENGRFSICRDGFHMNYLYGRYALACIWARTICNVNLEESNYLPSTDYYPLQKADPEVIAFIRTKAMEQNLFV